MNNLVINNKSKNGQLLIIGIIFMAVILILSASLFGRVSSFLGFGASSIAKEQATNLAEGGVDYAIRQLNKNAGSFPAFVQKTVGTTGEFYVTVDTNTPNVRKIVSTGYVPNKANPKAKKTIKAEAIVSGETVSFRFAVQVGSGGISMANSSEIRGTAYSNGSITGSGPSTIDGDAYAVVNVQSPPLVTGTIHDQDTNGPVEASEMPEVDYQYWKDAANINNNPQTCSPTCEITSTPSQPIGPKKYIGNLTIRESGTVVTMNGPIHVTGNFTIRNSSTLKLSETFGSSGSVLIVDGNITVENNGYFLPTSANPKGYILVVTTSNSANAISISNMGATAVFYALSGTATLRNQAKVTAVVADTLVLQQQASLIYDTGLASSGYSNGPGGSWQIKKGTYKFGSSP